MALEDVFYMVGTRNGTVIFDNFDEAASVAAQESVRLNIACYVFAPVKGFKLLPPEVEVEEIDL